MFIQRSGFGTLPCPSLFGGCRPSFCRWQSGQVAVYESLYDLPEGLVRTPNVIFDWFYPCRRRSVWAILILASAPTYDLRQQTSLLGWHGRFSLYLRSALSAFSVNKLQIDFAEVA